jgi:hypothetical protein
MADETITLWRPVGPKELKLIEAAEMRAFPPRLPEQPIFYPVLTEDYAVKIARDWNVRASGAGYVTRFEVRRPDRGGPAVSRRLSAADCGDAPPVPASAHGRTLSAPVRFPEGRHR